MSPELSNAATVLRTTNHPYTDQEFLDGIRRRDNAVLAAVYRLYCSRVTAFIKRQGGSEQEAQDVLQEAIIAVFINVQRPDFYFINGFEAYLFGICQHQWLKKNRYETRRSRVSLDTPEVLHLDADTAAAGEYADRQRLFMEKFKALPEGCRELLRLSVLEGKTPEVTAGQLGFGSLNYYYKRKSHCKDKLEALVRADPNFDQY